jgi:hypothetical protein
MVQGRVGGYGVRIDVDRERTDRLPGYDPPNVDSRVVPTTVVGEMEVQAATLGHRGLGAVPANAHPPVLS